MDKSGIENSIINETLYMKKSIMEKSLDNSLMKNPSTNDFKRQTSKDILKATHVEGSIMKKSTQKFLKKNSIKYDLTSPEKEKAKLMPTFTIIHEDSALHRTSTYHPKDKNLRLAVTKVDFLRGSKTHQQEQASKETFNSKIFNIASHNSNNSSNFLDFTNKSKLSKIINPDFTSQLKKAKSVGSDVTLEFLDMLNSSIFFRNESNAKKDESFIKLSLINNTYGSIDELNEDDAESEIGFQRQRSKVVHPSISYKKTIAKKKVKNMESQIFDLPVHSYIREINKPIKISDIPRPFSFTLRNLQLNKCINSAFDEKKDPSSLILLIKSQIFIGGEAFSPPRQIKWKGIDWKQNPNFNKRLYFDLKYDQLPMFASIVIKVKFLKYGKNGEFSSVQTVGWANFRLFDHNRKLKTGIII
jgi:hypothetical protein